jgi:hypothetical protein
MDAQAHAARCATPESIDGGFDDDAPGASRRKKEEA